MNKLTGALNQVGQKFIVHELWGDSLITRARNRLVARFMRSDCTDLLFIDSDIEFRASDVLRLLLSGHKFCGAPYPAKAKGGRLIGTPLTVDGVAQFRDGWCQAQDLPTGFMLVSREVFEAVAPHTCEVDDDSPDDDLGKYHVFFDTAVHNRQYLSEDWAFTRFAREHGFDPMLDVTAKLKHWGDYGYEAPSYEELAAQAPAAPAAPEPKRDTIPAPAEVSFNISILHGPGPEREAALKRLSESLGEDNPGEYTCLVEKGPGPEHAFNGRRWQRALDEAKLMGFTHCVFLDDDVVVCPQFARRVRQVILGAPEKIIGLHAPHPAAKEAWEAGEKWITTSDGTLGPANVIPTPMLERFLHWRGTALRDGALESIDSDVLLGLFCRVHGLKVWHPVPTITDHDTMIVSTFGNENTRGRRSALTWKTVPLPESWEQSVPVRHVGDWFGEWCDRNRSWLKQSHDDPAIYPTGFWSGPNVAAHHAIDPGLAKWIAGWLPKEHLIRDLGCGTGGYLRVLAESGFPYLIGFDGEVPHPRLFGNVQQFDLTMKANWLRGNEVQSALFLEVAEHIPAQYEDTVLDNVASAVTRDGFLIMSWATRGQGGHGHVNCRNNDEVIPLLEKRGLRYSFSATNIGRAHVTTLPWFKNTLLVFERAE